MGWRNILYPFSAPAGKVSECSFAALRLDHSLPPRIRFYCIIHYTTTTTVSSGLPLARVYAEPSGGCLLLHCFAVFSFAALFCTVATRVIGALDFLEPCLDAHEDCISLVYACDMYTRLGWHLLLITGRAHFGAQHFIPLFCSC